MRVVLVDDHALVREGLRELFSREPDLVVVGEAASAEEALRTVQSTRPDGVVVDLSLGREMGFSLLAALRELDLKLKLLVLSMHDESVFAELALANGANGYVGKHESSEVIVRALRRVLSGRTHVSEAISDRLLGSLSQGSSRHIGVESPIGRLTDREIDVLRRIGLGRATREIASELRISAKTVETHRSRIKEKLRIRTGSELVVVAVNWLRDGFLDIRRPR
jgi:DNA-binding NarL/FixJ family response regulator